MVEVIHGVCHFQVACAPQTRQVFLVGDFSGWTAEAIPMYRDDDGVWRLCVQLPPGDYVFRYLTGDGRWLTDFAAFGVTRNRPDEWDSVVHVP